MVNMYKLRLTLLQQEILRLLFMRAGMTFNARGLAVELKVSQPAIGKALPGLESRGFVNVSKDRASKRLSISLNRENPTVIGTKRADNLRQIYESGLAEYFREKFPSCAVIVFGSFSRGEDIHSSDIDIAVVGSRSKNTGLDEFEKIFSKKINVNFYGSFKEIDAELKSNIIGGILLSGWVEL